MRFPGKVVVPISRYQDSRIILKGFPYIGGQFRGNPQPLQGSDYIYRERFEGRPLFLRESAIPGIHAFFAQRAAFAHQAECLVIAFQEKQPLEAYGSLPAANQTGPLPAIVAIKTRQVMGAFQQERHGVLGNDFANLLRSWCRRGTAPTAVV